MRELTQEELLDLEKAGVSQEDLAKHWDIMPNQDFVTAVGEVLKFKEGLGQERSEPFAEVPQAPEHFAPTPPADATSVPVTELPESDPQHVAVGENGWPVAEAPAEAAPAEGLSGTPATRE